MAIKHSEMSTAYVNASMWRDSLHKFAWDLAHGEIDVDTDAKAIAAAMHRLDEDILKEAWQYGSKDVSSVWGNLRSETREFFRNVGRTGCVGSVALIKQGVLTIAESFKNIRKTYTFTINKI